MRKDCLGAGKQARSGERSGPAAFFLREPGDPVTVPAL